MKKRFILEFLSTKKTQDSQHSLCPSLFSSYDHQKHFETVENGRNYSDSVEAESISGESTRSRTIKSR